MVQLLVKFKADKRMLARRWLDLFHFDFVNLLKPAGCLPRLGFVRGKTPHKFLQFADALFRPRICGQLTLARLRAREHIVVVIAGIDFKRAVVDIGHMRAHCVQEMMIIVESRWFSASSSQRIVWISRLLVGSSSSSTSGSANNACASNTRNFQPGAIALIKPPCCSSGIPTPSNNSAARACAV